MKKLLILGGFPQMIDIVMTAKQMGVFTIVADNNPESSSKRFADKSFDISTDNIDELEKLCKEESVDGIFTGFEDFNIHIARELCSRLSLPFYATKEQLGIVTNKLEFKDTCRKYDVPVIEQYSLDEALSEGKYPYIIKPADSYGSRGITICQNDKELETGYQKAVSVSKTDTAIIERYIDYSYGTELFYTIVNGRIHLTVTADRHTVQNGKTTVPLPVAEVFPSRHRDDMVDRIDGKIRSMLSGMGIQNGLVLIQALYDGKDYFVYEMAYRFTGEQHYRLLEKQHGVNLAEMMIKHALGHDISEYDTSLLDDESFTKPSINLAVILNHGTIREISGLEKVYKIDEVISYNLTHKEKDVVSASGDYSHMLIRVNMVAKSYRNLCDAVKKVADYVTVTNDKGEDMLAARFVLPEDI
jgi:biotin carboxylase